MKCPKCGFNSAENDACSNCGIIFSKYKEIQDRKTNMSVKLKNHSVSEVPSEKPTQF
jgi:predicted nucleic-acid-binding Zn-ribbon protein